MGPGMTGTHHSRGIRRCPLCDHDVAEHRFNPDADACVVCAPPKEHNE